MNLTHLTPILNVSDVSASLDWFEALGWERGIAWDYERGMPPTDEPRGIREFHLRHPDGHTFRVGCESGR